MSFTAGEVEERRSELPVIHSPQINLKSILEEKTGFGRTMRQDIFRFIITGEPVHQRYGITADSEDIEVSDCLLSSAETSSRDQIL